MTGFTYGRSGSMPERKVPTWIKIYTNNEENMAGYSSSNWNLAGQVSNLSTSVGNFDINVDFEIPESRNYKFEFGGSSEVTYTGVDQFNPKGIWK